MTTLNRDNVLGMFVKPGINSLRAPTRTARSLSFQVALKSLTGARSEAVDAAANKLLSKMKEEFGPDVSAGSLSSYLASVSWELGTLAGSYGAFGIFNTVRDICKRASNNILTDVAADAATKVAAF